MVSMRRLTAIIAILDNLGAVPHLRLPYELPRMVDVPHCDLSIMG